MAECDHILTSLLDSGQVAEALTYGASNKEAIAALQTLLFQLGFGSELNWSQYGADGLYGNSTTAAVKAFAGPNGFSGSDGKTVDDSFLRMLLQRYDVLEELQTFWHDLQAGTVPTKYKFGSTDRAAIVVLQVLLNEKGYGSYLNWERYGADGHYGASTQKAVAAFAQKVGQPGDGKVVTQEIGVLLMDEISEYYGGQWRSTVVQEVVKSPALQEFSSTRFSGKKLSADIEFFPVLKRVEEYAEKADVMLYITSSFRLNANVQGAIVKPATRSNHMVGHAIDFNVLYGSEYASWCNSTCLKQSVLPGPVAEFIALVRNDSEMRWGGDFSTPDVVHIDDGLNVRDPAAWDARYEVVQQAAAETS